MKEPAMEVLDAESGRIGAAAWAVCLLRDYRGGPAPFAVAWDRDAVAGAVDALSVHTAGGQVYETEKAAREGFEGVVRAWQSLGQLWTRDQIRGE